MSSNTATKPPLLVRLPGGAGSPSPQALKFFDLDEEG